MNAATASVPATSPRRGRSSKRLDPRRARLYVETLKRQIEILLDRRLEAYARAGRDIASLGTPEELAERMAVVLPAPSPWDERLGPFYRSAQMARLLGGISRQALAERRRRRTILGLKTADGMIVYPAFQLDERCQVVQGLAETLRCFPPGDAEAWAAAGWLASPKTGLSGLSPIAWLKAGRPRPSLLALARDAGRRLAA
ncbi:MAG: hypothetical protein D6696_21345 [Acidobacteria bacterium]|nr:MAG: hypothetical protein D6696_21345 [Acidobacteriota bacterium]